MEKIIFHTFASDPQFAAGLKNLVRHNHSVMLSGSSNSFKQADLYLRDCCLHNKFPDIIFIKDCAFHSEEIINFLNAHQKEFNKEQKRVEAVVYTASTDTVYLDKMIELDVHGILHRNDSRIPKGRGTEAERFIEILRGIKYGCLYYDRTVLACISRSLWSWRCSEELFFTPLSLLPAQIRNINSVSELIKYVNNTLSEGEYKLFYKMGLGKPNHEIADELNIAQGTAEQRKEHIKVKFEFKTTQDLAKFAIFYVNRIIS